MSRFEQGPNPPTSAGNDDNLPGRTVVIEEGLALILLIFRNYFNFLVSMFSLRSKAGTRPVRVLKPVRPIFIFY